MIALKRKEDCCGCTACASICPTKCISMQEDSEGFKYPQVDSDKCINCHKCEAVCPVMNRSDLNDKPQAYLTRTKDKALLSECTSGGVFTEIAKQTVKSGGIAYGAVFGENFIVRHERISDLSGVNRLPGSKYVQSDLDGVFRQVLTDVRSGKQVAFCGTPCQVAGLKNYIGKDYSNLLLVDLVCHGVPSPRLWNKYVDYLQSKYGKLKHVNFRSKYLGYHVSVMEEQFESGKVQIGSARTNLMSKCFFKNAADRPICYECPFKTVGRCSDLTLFDGWHASEYVPGLKDDDMGYTIVLVQSEKNVSLLKSFDCLETYKIDINQAIALDGKMAVNSVSRPSSRAHFYKLLSEKGIDGTVETLFRISKVDLVIEISKHFLNKVGILQKVKRIKR